MMDWWNSLGGLGQLLACISIPSTIVLIVQTVFVLLTGFDGDGDIDVVSGEDIDDIAGFEESGLQIFSIRGFLTFFAIFGWSGIWLISIDLNVALSLTIAFVLGSAAMIGTAYAIKFLLKLQAVGNQNIKDALGVSGTVYITIPPARKGNGKVSAVVSGRLSEFDAVTDDLSEIPTGTAVTVVSVTDPNILVVTKKG